MAVLAVVGRTTRDVVDSGRPRPGGVPFHAASALQLVGEGAILVTRCAAEDRAGIARATRSVRPAGHLGGGARTAHRSALTTREAAGWSPSKAWANRGTTTRSGAGSAARFATPTGFTSEPSGETSSHRSSSPSSPGTAGSRSTAMRLSAPHGQGRSEPDAAFDPATLAEVDLLHLSEDEVEILGLTLEANSLQTLGVPEVIVTLGERGSLVVADGLLHSVPAQTSGGNRPNRCRRCLHGRVHRGATRRSGSGAVRSTGQRRSCGRSCSGDTQHDLRGLRGWALPGRAR